MTPIYPLVDRTFFDGSGKDFNAVMNWFKQRERWGLQDDGLSAAQKLGPEWSGRPLALEQLGATSASGDQLSADIRNGLEQLHGSYLLIYRSDIDNSANAATLRQTSTQASGSS